MSNPTDSAATKEQIAASSPRVQSSDFVTHAVPLTTILPQTSTKTKAKSYVKKEKLPKVSKTTSPSSSSKKSKSKSRKSKSRTTPKVALSMTDLYLSENPFKSSNDESDVTTSGTIKSTANVDATDNASGTLGLEKPRSVENLGEDCPNPSVNVNPVAEASTKADDNPTVDFVQKVVSETHVEQDVTPSGQTSDKLMMYQMLQHLSCPRIWKRLFQRLQKIFLLLVIRNLQLRSLLMRRIGQRTTLL
ncbi:hypothetical protein A2U01_0021673 [Trifolium medium]|uniref:Uncharacterized protein n=1 Tax=Trifolium medium TaxID=97028 RepID=A0A392NLE1_9FABA|nr:hypothetical protein [Trifolium medium]